MNRCKKIIVILLALNGAAKAGEFRYEYEIIDKTPIDATLEYKNINALYDNIQHATLILKLLFSPRFTVSLHDSKGLLATTSKDELPPWIILSKGIPDIQVKTKAKDVRELSPDEKDAYEWGMEVMKDKFKVTILPPQPLPLPWYRRYAYYMLAALGLGATGYLYFKYGQKGATH